MGREEGRAGKKYPREIVPIEKRLLAFYLHFCKMTQMKSTLVF